MIVVAFETKLMSLFLGLSTGIAMAQPADLVLRNGKLVTLEQGAPEAQGLAARGGRMIAALPMRRVCRARSRVSMALARAMLEVSA